MRTEHIAEKARLGLCAFVSAKAGQGVVLEFARLESVTIRDLAKYDITPADIARCIEDATQQPLDVRALLPGVNLSAIVALVGSQPEPAPSCEAAGCKAAATRVVYGKHCCDNEAHRAEGTKDPRFKAGEATGRRH